MILLAIIGGIVLFVFILAVVMWQSGLLKIEVKKEDE